MCSGCSATLFDGFVCSRRGVVDQINVARCLAWARNVRLFKGNFKMSGHLVLNSKFPAFKLNVKLNLENTTLSTRYTVLWNPKNNLFFQFLTGGWEILNNGVFIK